MDRVECVVIGAGVIGLAVARRLAQAGREVIVLEEAEGIGTVTSSRNSEVIHAGIYYRAGSWMARMCVAGKHALYRYCDERGIPQQELRQADRRDQRRRRPKSCNRSRRMPRPTACSTCRLLSGEAARALEPALNCDAALLSPSTGIIDSHAYMLSLRGEAEAAGAAFAFHTPLIRAKASAGRDRARGRRRSADDACNAACSSTPPGSRRTGGGAQHRRHAARPDSAGLSRQGKLFQLQRAGAVLAADLSGAGARRARRAPHARHGRAGTLRPRRRMGRRRSTTRSIRRARSASIRRSADTGRRCRTAR